MTATVFIYCDQHPKRVAVTNFDQIDGGNWTERYCSRAEQGRRESGQTIIDGNPATGLPLLDDSPTGLAMIDQLGDHNIRSRYAPYCRKCNAPVFQAREDNLVRVLNLLADSGIREAAGGLIADILARRVVVSP